MKACMRSYFQILAHASLVFAQANITTADAAYWYDILWLQGKNCATLFEPNVYEVEDNFARCVHEDSLAFGGRGIGKVHSLARKKFKFRPKLKLEFDSTRGFPGEGWSSIHKNLTMGTWNTRSLTFERFNYCKSLNLDVLVLTELWRTQNKFTTARKNFITSEPIQTEEGIRFPKDRAAGVGIILSDTAEQKVESFGSQGERLCWVRLRGPACNLFIIAVYLPHRGRVQPSQDDTIRDLQVVLKKVPSHDCICIMDDFNEQLQKSVENRTGKWTSGAASKNSVKILELMQMYDPHTHPTHTD